MSDVFLNEIAKRLYKAYGTHTIEDRAIFGEIDGLKPVARRLLWAAHKMRLASYVKAARVVGDTMGKYHPHGDASIYGALVTAVNSPMPLFDGSGNWGTMTDPPAAMRYTECKLSKYAQKVFFDPFYMVEGAFVPNYDDKDEEPLVLTTLLPNTLLNGNFGIAPGVNTRTPAVTLKSMIKVLVATLKKGQCTPTICLGLEYTTDLGGVLRQTPTIKQDLLEFYKTGRGRFVFDSSYVLNEKTNSIRIDRFAPIGNIEGSDSKNGYKPGILDKVASITGVVRVNDESSEDDRFNAYNVTFTKTLKGSAREAVIKKVMDAFSAAVSFNVQAVERLLDKSNTRGTKQLVPLTVPELIDTWVEYRIALEKKACRHWVNKYQADIDRLNLLRLAVKSRDFIIKALDKLFSNEELEQYIAKNLKITVEDAKVILDLRVRQLRALEDKELVAKIKAIKADIAGLQSRIAKPKHYIATHVITLLKELDRKEAA